MTLVRRDTIEVYKDAAARWRWRYVAQNGNVLADSGQSYTRRVDAVRAAKRVTGSRLTRSVRIVITAATSADLVERFTLDAATVVTGVPAEPWTPDRPTRFEN